MLARLGFLMLAGGLFIAGCNNDTKTPVSHAPESKKLVLTDPFKFHKMIESSPGKYYDVLSWGRGSADTGAFMILHSDSSGRKYTTTTGDLNGVITDVYNTDMDVDGNPEIIIQAKRKDTINFTTIYAFEFSDNKANKLDFPKLTGSQKKGYRGNDNFYIEDGKFIREFPIYDGNNKDAKLTGAKRKLQYGLQSNSFTVKQLSKDSTVVKATKEEQPKPVKKEEKPEKKKKHHEPEHKKTHKKKHRHRSDD